MLLGYNTNGFAHHRLEDALTILSDLGYRSVALTLDHHILNPFAADLTEQLQQTRQLLHKLDLRCVIETGARFLLDPWRKHQPTLLDADLVLRERRFDFLCRAIEIAHELSADAVSFWSGVPATNESAEVLLSRLAEQCLRLCDFAERHRVRLAFEPEPGMLIDTMTRYAELQARVAHPAFGLTIDIGHLHCLGEVPIVQYLRQWREVLWNIHLEDMKQGVHDHLMFGEGEIDFAPVLQTLQEIGYTGGVYVELSRHSYDAVATARRAWHFLTALLPQQGVHDALA